MGELAGIFAEVVELAKQSGYLLPDVDPLLMSHVLINIGARIAAYCSMPSVPYDTGTLLSESLRMTLAGVLTQLGRERLEELQAAGTWVPGTQDAADGEPQGRPRGPHAATPPDTVSGTPGVAGEDVRHE